jgi:hypothetical protein
MKENYLNRELQLDGIGHVTQWQGIQKKRDVGDCYEILIQ